MEKEAGSGVKEKGGPDKKPYRTVDTKTAPDRFAPAGNDLG